MTPTDNYANLFDDASPSHTQEVNYGLVDMKKNNVYDNILIGEWGTGLFACCDHKFHCIKTTLCPCVSLAQIASRLGLYSYFSGLRYFGGLYIVAILLQILRGTLQGTPECGYKFDYTITGVKYMASYGCHEKQNFFSYVLDIASLVLIIIVFFGITELRFRTRKRFQIPGYLPADLVVTCFCSCCAIIQIGSHIKSYKPGKFSVGPVDTLPPYNPDDERGYASL